jgi:phosphate/phosphite/phosphonate ABC transporter binding protein
MSFPRIQSILSAAVLLISVTAGCDTNKHRVEVLPAPADSRKIIRVVASDENISAFRKLVEGYSASADLTVEIIHAQSADIPGILRKGGADLGVTARRPGPGIIEGDINYVPFAWDGAVFIAGEDAGVTALTSAQLAAIYGGRIANWKEVGGKDLPIRVVERPANSILRAAAESMAGHSPASRSSALPIETSEAVLHATRTITGILACVPLSRTLVEKFPVVPLAIDGRLPVSSADREAAYPYRLEYAMIFRKDAPDPVKEMANHIVSVEGIHQITSLGLVAAVDKFPVTSCHCRATDSDAVPKKRTPLSGTLTIGVIPELGAISQEKRYAGISQAISERLDVDTRVKHLLTYGEVVNAFQEGRIDAAFVGSLAYAKLRTRLGVVPVARPESGGVSWYRGVVVVRADGRLRNLSGLRGKRFAYVPDTSAGELCMRSILRRMGASDPGAFFGRAIRARSHEEAIRMVLEGKADAAAVKDLVLRRIVRGEPGMAAHLREIDRTSTFPENALVVSREMNEQQVGRFRDLLLSMHKSVAGRRSLEALGADRFVPTADADYANVYALASDTGYPLEKK